MTRSLIPARLSFLLLLFMGSAVASGVALWMGLSSIRDGRQASVRLAEVQTRNLAMSIDHNISGTLERIDDTLRSVEGYLERELESGSIESGRTQAFLHAEQRLLPEAVAIRVTDAEGRVILNNPSGDPQASFVDRPFWAFLRDHPDAGTFVTKPILGTFTKRWVITSARRYTRRDGRFGGVVVIPAFVEVFEKSMRGFDVGERGLLTLRDSDGGFVARGNGPSDLRIQVGDQTISEELRAHLASKTPQATYHALLPTDGIRRVVTLRRIQHGPYVVLASLAEGDYLAQWRKDRTRTLLLLALFLVGVWTFAGLQWRSWKARERDSEGLRESQARLNAVVTHSRDAIGVSRAGVHVMVNPAYMRMFGFHSESEAYQTPVLDLIAPESRNLVNQYIRDRLAGNSPPSSYEVLAQRLDGSTFEMEVNASSYVLNGILYTLVVLRDVTERKQAAKALIESEHRFRSTLSELTEGCMILGFNWEVLFVNAAAASHGGKSLKDFEGQNLLTVIPEMRYTELFRRYQACMSDRVPQRFEHEYRYPDGTTKVFLFSILPVPEGIFLLTLDVTDERKKAAEMEALHKHLARIQKMESLGSLAGGVAHDMNNVVGAILGMASTQLEKAPAGSETAHAMGTIVKACQRGADMVKGLLGFAREGLQEEKSVDLNGLIEDTVALLKRTTLQKVQLKMDLEPRLHAVSGDASALSHVFMNLCINAVDAMPEGGTLTLRTCNENPSFVRIEVEDTGCGMSSEILEKATDPFFTTKEQGKGTGLGLAIVFRTIHAHGGFLEFRSEPERGTCVSIRLPATAEAPPVLSGAEEAHGPQTRLDVLLVDDDELIQLSMSAMLEALGHDASIASDGEMALRMLESRDHWDVVILDMNMPGLSGAATLPRIRALYPRLPVLLASGRADKHALDLTHAFPGVELIPKPFGIEELRRHLDAIP